LLKAESVLNYKYLKRDDQAQDVLQAGLAQLIASDPDISNARLAELLGVIPPKVAFWRPEPPRGRRKRR
jgi:hypothetical protein